MPIFICVVGCYGFFFFFLIFFKYIFYKVFLICVLTKLCGCAPFFVTQKNRPSMLSSSSGARTWRKH